MKKENAVRHLRTFMWMVQRARSNATDPLLGFVVSDDDPGLGLQITESMMADLMPWVFGDRCVLPALDKILGVYDRTGELAPMDYYNQMFILDRFLGALKAFHLLFDRELPAEQQIPDGPPCLEVMLGWQE